jgi:pyridoxamine 5'-phosphate oxidase
MRDIREEYRGEALTRAHLDDDPLDLLERWVNEAVNAQLPLPNAMTLATVSDEGCPSSRVVLLKGIEDDALLFFTHYDSRKGLEIAANPAVAATFFWEPFARQVTLTGRASRLDEQASREYFASRPRGSQLSALISPQSRPVSGEWLAEAAAEAERRYRNEPVPMPENWGGYRIQPEEIQFWHGRPDRLHDRFRYLRSDQGWSVERLAP